MNNDDYTTRPTGSSTADKGEIFICVPRIIPPIVIAWKMMVGGGGLFQGGGPLLHQAVVVRGWVEGISRSAGGGSGESGAGLIPGTVKIHQAFKVVSGGGSGGGRRPLGWFLMMGGFSGAVSCNAAGVMAVI